MVVALGESLWEEVFGRKSSGGSLWEEIFGRKSSGGSLWEEFFGRKSLGVSLWEEVFGKKSFGGSLLKKSLGRSLWEEVDTLINIPSYQPQIVTEGRCLTVDSGFLVLLGNHLKLFRQIVGRHRQQSSERRLFLLVGEAEGNDA